VRPPPFSRVLAPALAGHPSLELLEGMQQRLPGAGGGFGLHLVEAGAEVGRGLSGGRRELLLSEGDERRAGLPLRLADRSRRAEAAVTQFLDRGGERHAERLVHPPHSAPGGPVRQRVEATHGTQAKDAGPPARVSMPDLEQRGYRAYPLADHVADKGTAILQRATPPPSVHAPFVESHHRCRTAVLPMSICAPPAASGRLLGPGDDGR
jgi:hypothetical protein